LVRSVAQFVVIGLMLTADVVN